MTTTNCTKDCRLYRTADIPAKNKSQVDLAIKCSDTLVTQVPFKRGYRNNRFDAEYDLWEKAQITPCISPELKNLFIKI